MFRAPLAGIGLIVGLCSLAGCNGGSCDSCAAKGTDKAMSSPRTIVAKSLYDRLGGEPAVRAVVDDFVGRAASDPAVNFTRKGEGNMEWAATSEHVEHLKQGLRDFICVTAGGPCTYKGMDMKSAHAGMHITDSQFTAIGADLKESLDKFKVPAREQNELLSAVEATRRDIVARTASGY